MVNINRYRSSLTKLSGERLWITRDVTLLEGWSEKLFFFSEYPLITHVRIPSQHCISVWSNLACLQERYNQYIWLLKTFTLIHTFIQHLQKFWIRCWWQSVLIGSWKLARTIVMSSPIYFHFGFSLFRDINNRDLLFMSLV